MYCGFVGFVGLVWFLLDDDFWMFGWCLWWSLWFPCWFRLVGLYNIHFFGFSRMLLCLGWLGVWFGGLVGFRVLWVSDVCGFGVDCFRVIWFW